MTEECEDTFKQDVTDDVSKHYTDDRANLQMPRCKYALQTRRTHLTPDYDVNVNVTRIKVYRRPHRRESYPRTNGG